MTGSPVYENWKAYAADAESDVVFEFPLYSDTDGVHDIRSELGPYEVLRTLREVPTLQDCPSLILRVTRHKWLHNDQLGGGIPEEMASLLSLLSGTRLAAGGNYIRRFGFDGDPLGQPIFSGPAVVVPRPTMSRINLPHVTERRGLDESLLRGLPNIGPEQSLVLAKSARLYRQALWYSDAQPEFTWLMLVSAVETAAGFWKKGRLSPEEQLRELRPNLAKLLLDTGGENLLQAVSRELADYMGATRKFIEFLSYYSLDLDRLNSRADKTLKDLRFVYGARSKALHAGTAIPDRMPIDLADFEKIARSALLGWWGDLTS